MERTVANYKWKYPAECYLTFGGEDRRETAKRLYGHYEDIDLSKSWIEGAASHYYAAYKARPKEWWDERRNYEWRHSDDEYRDLSGVDRRLCDNPPQEVDAKIEAENAYFAKKAREDAIRREVDEKHQKNYFWIAVGVVILLAILGVGDAP